MENLQKILKSLTPPPPPTTILPSLPDISVSPSPITLMLPSFGETFSHQQFTACLQSPAGSTTIIKQEKIPITTPPQQKKKREPRAPKKPNEKEISPPKKPRAPRKKKVIEVINLTIDEVIKTFYYFFKSIFNL
jgi:hypothetical protein